MKKSEVRKYYGQERNLLSKAETEELSKKIFQNFVGTFSPESNTSVHCYLPLKERNEVDTTLFLDYFHQRQIRVFVPVVAGDEMHSVPLTPQTQLFLNKWGIAEPELVETLEIVYFDYVIVPLLYCDDRGNRVGYGKGFYDRFFARINADAVKIGLTFFGPAESVDDVSPFDVPLDYLVTPAEVLSFGSATSKPRK